LYISDCFEHWFVDVGNFFFISGFFKILIQVKADQIFCTNEIEPERQQNEQAPNTKLSQEEAVTITQANKKVMPEIAGTKFVSTLKLIARVTTLVLYSLVIVQIANQQYLVFTFLQEKNCSSESQMAGWMKLI
jgi:hypothetical protein